VERGPASARTDMTSPSSFKTRCAVSSFVIRHFR
jgi:hypothetical protein